MVDFICYEPAEAVVTASALTGRTRCFVFITTDSVYEVCAPPPALAAAGFAGRGEHWDRLLPLPARALRKMDAYGHSKWLCERVFKLASGPRFPYVGLRLPDVMGEREAPRSRLFQLQARTMLGLPVFLHKDKQFVGTGAADKKLSFVYAGDVAAAAVAAAAAAAAAEKLPHVAAAAAAAVAAHGYWVDASLLAASASPAAMTTLAETATQAAAATETELDGASSANSSNISAIVASDPDLNCYGGLSGFRPLPSDATGTGTGSLLSVAASDASPSSAAAALRSVALSAAAAATARHNATADSNDRSASVSNITLHTGSSSSSGSSSNPARSNPSALDAEAEAEAAALWPLLLGHALNLASHEQPSLRELVTLLARAVGVAQPNFFSTQEERLALITKPLDSSSADCGAAKASEMTDAAAHTYNNAAPATGGARSYSQLAYESMLAMPVSTCTGMPPHYHSHVTLATNLGLGGNGDNGGGSVRKLGHPQAQCSRRRVITHNELFSLFYKPDPAVAAAARAAEAEAAAAAVAATGTPGAGAAAWAVAVRSAAAAAAAAAASPAGSSTMSSGVGILSSVVSPIVDPLLIQQQQQEGECDRACARACGREWAAYQSPEAVVAARAGLCKAAEATDSTSSSDSDSQSPSSSDSDSDSSSDASSESEAESKDGRSKGQDGAYTITEKDAFIELFTTHCSFPSPFTMDNNNNSDNDADKARASALSALSPRALLRPLCAREEDDEYTYLPSTEQGAITPARAAALLPLRWAPTPVLLWSGRAARWFLRAAQCGVVRTDAVRRVRRVRDRAHRAQRRATRLAAAAAAAASARANAKGSAVNGVKMDDGDKADNEDNDVKNANSSSSIKKTRRA